MSAPSGEGVPGLHDDRYGVEGGRKEGIIRYEGRLPVACTLGEIKQWKKLVSDEECREGYDTAQPASSREGVAGVVKKFLATD